MLTFFTINSLVFFAAVQAFQEYDIVFENPPPEEENQGEFCMIPDVDGNIYRVNTTEVMSEELEFLEPRFAVRMKLFTPENSQRAQILDASNPNSLSNSNFNRNRPTRFVIHGWRADRSFIRSFNEAFMIDGGHDINLVVVDWRRGSNTVNYVTARRRVMIVGRYVAQFIESMVFHGGLNLSTTHLIGHSLGAHICGFAGKNLRSGKLAQITALDPAAPLFNSEDPSTRVAIGDAEYLEVIHTNAGLLGISRPIGDASFFPNGGRRQPGCGMDLTGSCAHARAISFMKESIVSHNGFRSYKCHSIDQIRRGRCTVRSENTIMGGEPGNLGRARGVYFVRTNQRPPFIVA